MPTQRDGGTPGGVGKNTNGSGRRQDRPPVALQRWCDPTSLGSIWPLLDQAPTLQSNRRPILPPPACQIACWTGWQARYPTRSKMEGLPLARYKYCPFPSALSELIVHVSE